jgi:hypothetical protein
MDKIRPISKAVTVRRATGHIRRGMKQLKRKAQVRIPISREANGGKRTEVNY